MTIPRRNDTTNPLTERVFIYGEQERALKVTQNLVPRELNMRQRCSVAPLQFENQDNGWGI